MSIPTAPFQAPAPSYQPPPPPPRKRHLLRNVLLAGGAIVVLIIVLAVALGGGKTPSSNTGNLGAGSNITSPAAQASTAPAASQPASQPASPAAPAAPQYTVSQQQAIIAAQGYLSMGSGFSYQGLIDQLSSSAGNGFSVADATFAANHVQVDWNQQALESAQGYMKMGGFSCSSLMDQLTSSYGEQFTQAQAAYAVQVVGLGSC